MINEEEQEVVRSVFRAYINDLKAHSTKTDRPTFKMLEEVKDKVIKALEQQPCEDAISRQAVMDCIDGYSQMIIRPIELKECIDKLPSVTPMQALEPCEDCISRQAVLDTATTIQTDDFSGNEIIDVVDIDDIKELPSVTPQQKIGHWIWKIDETPSTPVSPYELNYEGWICDCCHQFPDDICEWDDLDESPTYKYCPNCGARMEGCS